MWQILLHKKTKICLYYTGVSSCCIQSQKNLKQVIVLHYLVKQTSNGCCFKFLTGLHTCILCSCLFAVLMACLKGKSSHTGPTFTKVSVLIEIRLQMFNLTFLFGLLKGTAQFWSHIGRIAVPTFIHCTCIPEWIGVSQRTPIAQLRPAINVTGFPLC